MNFIAIDFETANYSRNSACAIGLVKYLDGKKADTFYSLIRPPRLYIRPTFTAIHGLTVEDVKDAPVFSEIWEDKILPFFSHLPLAAHNAQFDINVLCSVLEYYEQVIPDFSYFCTCNLARKCWSELKSHKLTLLAENFGIKYNAHNALDDAETCGKIALLAAEKYKATCVDDLLDIVDIKLKERS